MHPMDINQIRLQNLKTLIAECGTLTALADKADTSQSYISQVIHSTKNPNGVARSLGTRICRKIEAALLKPPGWMDLQHEQIELSQTDLRKNELPVLTWQQAIEWPELIKTVKFNEWMPKFNDLPYNCFCLKVVGEAMRNILDAKPTYPAGSIIYVNPHLTPNDLDCVIIQSPGASKAIFKQILYDDQRVYLKPMNPDWPDRIERLAQGSRIIGVVDRRYLMEN